MNLDQKIKLLIFHYVLLLFACVARAEKPNVVIILTDDAGYVDFGCYGGDFKTPNIDKLASNGIKFTKAYTSGSCCSPSRAGLLTGRYQNRFGHEFNLPKKPRLGDAPETLGMSVDEMTMADAMKQLGYHTGIVGKWHLGMRPEYHPMKRGFDEFFGFLHGARSYFGTEEAEKQEPIYRGFKEAGPQKYLTEAFTDEAINFVERNRTKPFFLYLSYNAVHTPMDALPEDEEKFEDIEFKKRRKLAAMTETLDREVGRFMSKLDELDLSKNTLIFFLNDNGGAMISNASDNGPLNGQKGTLYEGGIRVPFIIHWPDHLGGGKTFDDKVIALDIMPTAIAATGEEITLKNPLDGVDLLPHIAGNVKDEPHQTLYWRYNNCAAIHDGNYKLVRFPDRPAQLFDMKEDIGENHDLADRQRDKVKGLYNKLFEWECTLPYPRWRSGPEWFKEDVLRYSRDHIARERLK